jgi:hypothetical protein
VENKKLIGSGQCPFCGKDNRFEATEEEIKGFDKWQNGEMHIQHAMPLLSPEKREVLISGICITCQEEVFGISHKEETTEQVEEINSKDHTFAPEPIEYELNKLGYTLGEEENGVVEFVNEETNMALRLDYNLMSAFKTSKEKENDHDNGHTEDIYFFEASILRKYGFDINPDENDEEFIEEDFYDDYDDYLDDDEEYLDEDLDEDLFDIDDDLPF